jgi:L-threonylcarbamoyladenylate synthase
VDSTNPRILRVDPRQPEAGPLKAAVAALRRGQLVVVPTETVYGLAADPRVPGAVARLYAAKGRAAAKPVTLLAADVAWVARAVPRLAPAARALAGAFWPGPLTLVLRTAAGFEGFRVPDHPVARELLRRAGGLLAVTSANLSGAVPATTAAEALQALDQAVAIVLDAGPSPGGRPSTVVRVDGALVTVLRPGAIAGTEIKRVASQRR